MTNSDIFEAFVDVAERPVVKGVKHSILTGISNRFVKSMAENEIVWEFGVVLRTKSIDLQNDKDLEASSQFRTLLSKNGFQVGSTPISDDSYEMPIIFSRNKIKDMESNFFSITNKLKLIGLLEYGVQQDLVKQAANCVHSLIDKPGSLKSVFFDMKENGIDKTTAYELNLVAMKNSEFKPLKAFLDYFEQTLAACKASASNSSESPTFKG